MFLKCMRRYVILKPVFVIRAERSAPTGVSKDLGSLKNLNPQFLQRRTILSCSWRGST